MRLRRIRIRIRSSEKVSEKSARKEVRGKERRRANKQQVRGVAAKERTNKQNALLLFSPVCVTADSVILK